MTKQTKAFDESQHLIKDLDILDALINNAVISLGKDLTPQDACYIRNQICEMMRLKRDFYEALGTKPRRMKSRLVKAIRLR